MVDAPAKKQKRKGEFSEEDVCDLLQRYNAMQVVALLREVAQSADVKIDWNALAKKTETGITNARELQLLWRHIAYRQPLPDKIGEGDQPLDDDSDLEYELEPSPPVSTEFSVEVANCVKVLAFGSANESSIANNSAVEGDMLNGHPSKASSENPLPASLLHSSNMNLPAPVQRQPQTAGPSGEGFDNNFPSRRKRKPWSEEEDLELIAAVKKFGEGNWANIVKGEFKGDRTASQLSQRWAIIRKKQGSWNTGGASSQLSEVQLATRRALDMALKDNLTGGCGTVGNGAAPSSNHTNPSASNGDPTTSSNTQLQNPQVTNPNSMKAGTMGIPKPRPPVKKAGPMKSSVSDSIQAAAVAAGARIASPSDAATLFKAAQSKNAVRIMGAGATSLIKPSTPGSSSPLPPNVHFIRTGLAATSMATGMPPPPPRGSALKPTVPPAPSVSQLPKANEPQRAGDKTSIEVKVPVSDVKPMVEVREDNASPHSSCLPKAPGSTSTDKDSSRQTLGVDNSQCAMRKDSIKTEGKNEIPVDNEKQSMVQGKHGVSSSSGVEGNGVEKMEASSSANKSEPMDL